MNGLVNDALRLCTYILDTLPPYKTWAIVNIAKSNNNSFTYPAVKEIPTSFGYLFDNVPNILQDWGVIEAIHPQRWFIEQFTMDINRSAKDPITLTARKKGYISNKEAVSYYYRSEKYSWGFGPQAPGQFTILVNTAHLVRFIRYHSKQTPQFDLQSGVLSFINETARFDGEVERKSIKLLIDNINSIVTKEEFYNIPRGVSNYKTQIIDNKEPLHDSLEKMFTKIKKNTEKSQKLKKSLIFVQQSGFGVFINQRVFRINPQTNVDNSTKSGQ